ncbi:MAG: hypothetical protein PWP47_1696 [Synergistaceae bacterium]|nr:hypothetical protein [Synergistaceae bacterium]
MPPLPTALSLLFLQGIVLVLFRGKFLLPRAVKEEPERPFNAWQTAKGGIVLGTVVLLFLFTSLHRDLVAPSRLYGLTTVLSNPVSNVPAVMLLLPLVRDISEAGYILAVSRTFAGNLLIVGSLANIIVAGKTPGRHERGRQASVMGQKGRRPAAMEKTVIPPWPHKT